MSDLDFLDDFENDQVENNNKIDEIAISNINVLEQHRKEFNEEDLESLSLSIEKQGLLQPILVRYGQKEGEYILVAGERRLRACIKLGHKTIQAVVRDMEDTDHIINQVTENTARQDLTNYELVLAIVKLKGEGLSNKDIQDKIARSKNFVSQSLKIYENKNALNKLVEEPNQSIKALYDSYQKAGKANPLVEIEEENVLIEGSEEGNVPAFETVADDDRIDMPSPKKAPDPRLERAVTPEWRNAFEEKTGIDCDISKTIGENIKSYKDFVKLQIDALVDLE